MNKEHQQISKLMSLILRHKPEESNGTLSTDGWLDTETLIEGIRKKGYEVDMALIEEVVQTNDKQRFAFNGDHTQIRANQGHSVAVEVAMDALEPPEKLYHGTVDAFLSSILAEGLKKMNRLHVHLSADLETAQKVGSRRGKAIILLVDAKQMHNDGHAFYKSQNGVWLTDQVPPHYLHAT